MKQGDINCMEEKGERMGCIYAHLQDPKITAKASQNRSIARPQPNTPWNPHHVEIHKSRPTTMQNAVSEHSDHGKGEMRKRKKMN